MLPIKSVLPSLHSCNISEFYRSIFKYIKDTQFETSNDFILVTSGNSFFLKSHPQKTKFCRNISFLKKPMCRQLSVSDVCDVVFFTFSVLIMPKLYKPSSVLLELIDIISVCLRHPWKTETPQLSLLFPNLSLLTEPCSATA